MGQKFTADDLFRIAEDNLSDVESFEFKFLCTTFAFRKGVGEVFGAGLDVSKDERNLLEKIFTKFRSGGFLRGGR